MEKITKRSMYEALMGVATKGGNVFAGVADISDADLMAFCENEINLLDKKAAKAKETAAKKKAAGDELTDAVAMALSTDKFETIADIAAKIDGPDVTVSKVTYRLTQLVKAGKAEKSEVTIPATETSKARKVCAYRAIAD